MQREHTFIRNEVLASWWTNTVGAFLSTFVSPNFVLRKASAIAVEVPAGADDDLVAATIDGRLRWIEATISRAHPGGAAGTYDVFLTATDDVISSVPAPFTDNTVRAFALAVVAAGATPTIVPGSVDIHRKIGSLVWDGAAITSVTPDFGGRARATSFAAADRVDGGGVTGEAQPRYQRLAGGAVLLGPGGAVALDTQRERSAAGRERWGKVGGTLYEGSRFASGASNARPPVAAELEGLEWLSTDTGMVTKVVGGAWVNYGHSGLLLTVAQFLALPAQPDGTLVYVQLVAPTGTVPAVVATLRFNAGSASSAKWECLYCTPGGMFNKVSASQAFGMAAGVWGDLATVGPDITLPLGGDWAWEMGATVIMASNNASIFVGVATAAGGVPAGQQLQMNQSVSGVASVETVTEATSDEFTGLAANTLLRVRYSWATSNAPANSALLRWLRAYPRRVVGP